MSEKITRMRLDDAPRESLTDWARLDAMTEDDIERAIEDDPEWAAFNDVSDLQKRAGFSLFRGPDDQWRWLLSDQSGLVIGQSTVAYRYKGDAIAAVRDLFENISKAA